MSATKVFVDFNNRDREGFLRLNLAGTLKDLAGEMLVPERGMLMIGSDGDLFASIVVVEPGVEGIWRGKIVDGPWGDDLGHCLKALGQTVPSACADRHPMSRTGPARLP